MNKLKLLCIIMLSIFIAGCTADYNIEITDDKVIENFEFTETDSSKWDEVIFAHTDLTYKSSVLENANWPTGSFYKMSGNPYEPIKMDNVEYYEQELINNSDALGIKYNYTFDLNDYKDSNAVNSCFKDFSFVNGESKITLYAKDASYCFNGRKVLSEVNITLTSVYPVIEHNADEVSDGKYTWKIESKDPQDKLIKVTFSKDKNYKSKNNFEKVVESSSTSITLVVIMLIFLALLGGVVFYLYRKNKKLNGS